MRVTQKHLVYAGLTTIAVVSVFILYIGYVSWSPINAQAVAHIKPLMTEKQVEEILGSKCSHSWTLPERRVRDKVVPERTYKVWQDERAQCVVVFDSAGLVERAAFSEPRSPGIIEMVRSTLRLRW